MIRINWLRGSLSWATMVTLGSLVCTGCGGGDAPKPAAVAEAEKPAAAKPAGPNEVVHQFLDAVRQGKDDIAEKLLTEDALRETKRADLVVSPPGTETAKFEVGEFEIKADSAQVYSTWTDLDDEGKYRTDKIVWLLRKEDPGWRIGGMATTIFEGEPPLILNFEDPADMIYKQQELAKEMARRAAAVLNPDAAGAQPVQEARQPAAGTAPVNK